MRARALKSILLPPVLILLLLSGLVASSLHVSAGVPAGNWTLGTVGQVATSDVLQGIDCLSQTMCIGVGYDCTASCGTGSEVDQTLAELWNGTSWLQMPQPSGEVTSQVYQLLNVSCLSASECWAAGYFKNASALFQPLIMSWNGSVWSILPLANIAGESTTVNYQFTGISCLPSPATFCAADGMTWNGTVWQTYILTWSGGTTWSVAGSPSGESTSTQFTLYGVSCVSSSDCWAAGTTCVASCGLSSEDDESFFLNYNGTAWSFGSQVAESTTVYYGILGVSCASSSLCYAVGYIRSPNSGGVDQSLLMEWNGTTWSITSNPASEVTTSAYVLIGDSCRNATSCWAVGYETTSGYAQPLEMYWDGSTWYIVSGPSGVSASGNYYVHEPFCVSASYCWEVGDTAAGAPFVAQFGTICSGGALSLAAPASITVPGVTLNGSTQTTTGSLALTTNDETGTGNGWSLAVTSTTFTTGSGHTLPTTASTITGVSSLTAGTGNCALPTNSISYSPALTVPAGSTAPATGMTIFTAAPGTGEGPANETFSFAVAVPATAYAGTYTSTWYVSINAGP